MRYQTTFLDAHGGVALAVDDDVGREVEVGGETGVVKWRVASLAISPRP